MQCLRRTCNKSSACASCLSRPFGGCKTSQVCKQLLWKFVAAYGCTYVAEKCIATATGILCKPGQGEACQQGILFCSERLPTASGLWVSMLLSDTSAKVTCAALHEQALLTESGVSDRYT